MVIDIEPKLLSPADIDALIREAEALPNINKGLWSHNERELIGFCQRLAEALAGEHLLRRPDITGVIPAGYDLVAHLRRQIAFSERTFGPGGRAAGVIAHIQKELKEIEVDPADVTEWADVALLALDGAWRAGRTPEVIAKALEAKLAQNEARNWPDWRSLPPDQPIEHVRASDAAKTDLFPNAPPHHDYMQRLIRRADAAIVNLRDLEDNCDTDCAAEIAAIEELREALRCELRMRRSKAAPQNPHADAAVSEMSPLTLKIFDLLGNYGLTETRYDEDGAFPLIDALTLTDESIAQGRREAAALAEHLAAELEEWSAARLAENTAMKVAGCGAASDDPAEFQHRRDGKVFDRAKMEAVIDEEMRFFRGGKDAREWTNRRTAAAFRAEDAIFRMIEAGCGPIAAAAGAVAAAAKIGGGFTDHGYLLAELSAALRTGLAAAPKVSEEVRLAALRAAQGEA